LDKWLYKNCKSYNTAHQGALITKEEEKAIVKEILRDINNTQDATSSELIASIIEEIKKKDSTKDDRDLLVLR